MNLKWELAVTKIAKNGEREIFWFYFFWLEMVELIGLLDWIHSGLRA